MPEQQSFNTTHTIKTDHGNPLEAMPFNKVAQFALGAVIILVAFKLWWAGWFSTTIFEQTGYDEGLGFGVGLLPFLIDAVCLIGILGFTVFSFLRSLIGPLFSGFSGWVAGFRAERAATSAASSAAKSQGSAAASQASQPALDPNKVVKAINKLIQRVDLLEGLSGRVEKLEEIHPEVLPEPEPEPPTVESLASQIAQVRAELQQAKASTSGGTGKARATRKSNTDSGK